MHNYSTLKALCKKLIRIFMEKSRVIILENVKSSFQAKEESKLQKAEKKL